MGKESVGAYKGKESIVDLLKLPSRQELLLDPSVV
jgi:hypothetical protein